MTTERRRGRPPKPDALTGAERQRRHRAKLKLSAAFSVTGDGNSPSPPPFSVTGDGNPEHRALFTIPQGKPSDGTALTVRPLPEAKVITGDRELDAILWLGSICKIATDPGALDKAVEAATRVKAPHKDLESRYAKWLVRQPGAHPLFATAAAINVADIAGQAARALERITQYREGMTAFGSIAAAMEPTRPEVMVRDTICLPPKWDGWSALEPSAFADSVNPATLSEAVAELNYWRWLCRVRTAMSRTEHPSGFPPDPSNESSARERYVEGLLLVIAPRDRSEALAVADALQGGLVDIGSVDDGERRAAVLDHLLRALP